LFCHASPRLERMAGLTLLVAIIASLLILVLPIGGALAAYVAALVWYPDFLRVSLGTIDFSVGRIVILVLFVRCLTDNRLLKAFHWSRLDTYVTLCMAIQVGIYCLTRPSMAALENRGGFVMDTWFIYITFRMAMTEKAALISFIRWIGVILVPLAFLGVMESVTRWRPFVPLRVFRPWDTPVEAATGVESLRWGLARAVGPFSHPIMFGACFLTFLPLVWALRHDRGQWRHWAYFCAPILLIGALSSMSSNSWIMAMAVLFCLVMEKFKPWVKPVLILIVLGCALLQVVSTRPFYHVLASRANIVGGVWWQRVVLIDEAVKDFDKWWLLGYGGRDPEWAIRLSGGHTDVNNEYILAGVEYGMAGIIGLCLVLAAAFHGLVLRYRQTNDELLHSIYWAFGTILVGTMAVWMGVSYFGQPRLLFHAILGILGSLLTFADVGRVPQRHRQLDADPAAAPVY